MKFGMPKRPLLTFEHMLIILSSCRDRSRAGTSAIPCRSWFSNRQESRPGTGRGDPRPRRRRGDPACGPRRPLPGRGRAAHGRVAPDFRPHHRGCPARGCRRHHQRKTPPHRRRGDRREGRRRTDHEDRRTGSGNGRGRTLRPLRGLFGVHARRETGNRRRGAGGLARGCGCKSGIGATLAKMGVTHLVAGNMGDGAVRVLASHGISVTRGAAGNARAAVERFAARPARRLGHWLCRAPPRAGARARPRLQPRGIGRLTFHPSAVIVNRRAVER